MFLKINYIAFSSSSVLSTLDSNLKFAEHSGTNSLYGAWTCQFVRIAHYGKRTVCSAVAWEIPCQRSPQENSCTRSASAWQYFRRGPLVSSRIRRVFPTQIVYHILKLIDGINKYISGETSYSKTLFSSESRNSTKKFTVNLKIR